MFKKKNQRKNNERSFKPFKKNTVSKENHKKKGRKENDFRSSSFSKSQTSSFKRTTRVGERPKDGFDSAQGTQGSEGKENHKRRGGKKTDFRSGSYSKSRTPAFKRTTRVGERPRDGFDSAQGTQGSEGKENHKRRGGKKTDFRSGSYSKSRTPAFKRTTRVGERPRDGFDSAQGTQGSEGKENHKRRGGKKTDFRSGSYSKSRTPAFKRTTRVGERPRDGFDSAQGTQGTQGSEGKENHKRRGGKKTDFRSGSYSKSRAPAFKRTIKVDDKPKERVDDKSKENFPEENFRHTIIGIRPLEEAINREVVFHRLFLQKQESGTPPKFEKFIEYCKQKKINFFFADKTVLEEKSGHQNHQGVIAELKQDTRVVPDLKVYLKKYRPTGKVVIILDRLTDQQNLGAIARSAYFFGCHLIVTESTHSAPIDAVVHKTSSGASLMISFHIAEKLGQAITTLKSAGFEILSASSSQGEAVSIGELRGIYNPMGETPKKNYAVIMGSEGIGVRPHLDKLVDKKITIPRLNNFDSLNVSVATGIILFALIEARIIEAPETTEGSTL